MGRAMVPVMIPPAGASDFLARHGWAEAQILPLEFGNHSELYFQFTDLVEQLPLLECCIIPAC